MRDAEALEHLCEEFVLVLEIVEERSPRDACTLADATDAEVRNVLLGQQLVCSSDERISCGLVWYGVLQRISNKLFNRCDKRKLRADKLSRFWRD